MVTLSDIASAAGVSRYTVSKVMNGDASVKAVTRKNVMEICDRLGYVPNHNALGLVRGKTDLVALVVPYITDQFYSAMCEYCERLAAERGFTLIYKSSYNDAATEREIIRSFLSLKVCSMLIVPAVSNPDMVTHKLAASNVPVVYLDRPLNDECYCVLNNNYASAAMMTEHLLKSTGDLFYHDSFYGKSNPTAVDRHDGYAGTMRRHKLKPKYIPIKSPIRQDNELFAFENMSQFLRNGGTCGGIFCVTDAVALGCASAAQRFGLTPGKDIFIGGHDDLRFGAYTTPSMTTMRQDIPGMCRKAFEMLEKRLRHQTPSKRCEILDAELIVRCSG